MNLAGPKSRGRHWHEFATGHDLAADLAKETAQAIERRLASDGKAAIALSGGSTPRLFFAELSRVCLDWRHVYVTVADERWADPASERSNDKLIRDCLQGGAAQAAQIIPLKTANEDPEDALDEIERRVRALPLPLAAAILGMGEDGHTASLFPQADRLASALNPLGKRAVEAIRAPGAAEPRVTLTFPILNAADFLALHIEGERKLEVLADAEKSGPIEDMPIRAFLRAERPLQIFWTA